MKKTMLCAFSLLLMVAMLSLTACNLGDLFGGEQATPLAIPENLRVEDTVLRWNSVEYASGYTVLIDGVTTEVTETNSFSLAALKDGTYTLAVKANGDGILYATSAYSDSISYTRKSDTGEEYADQVTGAFGSFDEINTKNSFLGYGIDIINASAITSKNVLMSYPIFDMDKLMNETLLKSNEHYAAFESIEGATIEQFSKNMSNSTSITSGSHVAAKGKIKGITLGASSAFSAGFAARFTQTTDSVRKQHFLEVIAENQSYWLILQTSEDRYREILSEEFKRDLYNTAITPAQLFTKYGTHLLTSVAMGGNICMYYTMYSNSELVTDEEFAAVSAALKNNIEAAYGKKVSAEAGSETSFNAAFDYQEKAMEYGIQVDKQIVSAGGGAFGINNETTLYDNYYEWQKSLDAYPVLIGIKDANSLYPIWELLDLDVPGAAKRYNELYNYFVEYGIGSYEALCETYAITPSIAPADIQNITVGEKGAYTIGDTVQVKAGDILKIAFDVLPANANKYSKTFAVSDPTLASIDSTGVLTVAPMAEGGSYFTVTITAGSISRQITFYLVNSYNVTFNTAVNGIYVPPIVGIIGGYTIEEPSVTREGYTLDGWYRDAQNTVRFNFETDRVLSNMTLYAKWVAIKPTVSFEMNGAAAIDPVKVAYKSAVTEPKKPARTGYTFGGWFTDEDLTEKYDFATLLTEDITLYAKWEEIGYTVSFVCNGGIDIAEVTTGIEDGYKIEEPLTRREYYQLEGWYTDANLLKKFYFDSEITKDTVLYAKWVPIDAYVDFVDSDGVSPLYNSFGNKLTQQTTNIEKSFKIDAVTPYKEGYTFLGWYLNGVKIDLTTASDFKPKDTSYTLMAKWQINSYTVTYILGTQQYKKETYEFGETIVYPAVSKEGYEFSGWSITSGQLPDVMPAKNITVKGSLNVLSFTISYYVDGELYYTDGPIEYGKKITYIPYPTQSGKVFSGWTSRNGVMPTTMPAYNLVVGGSFDQNEFTVSYYLNGNLVHTETVIKGCAIPEYDPSREGHTFSGWHAEGYASVPTIMPGKNLTFTGELVVDTYIIRFDTLGGTSVPEIRAQYGATVTVPADPTREGYTFVGWDTEIPVTMPAISGGVMTVKAIWQANSYTIRFDTDGGSAIPEIRAEYGAAITAPVNPVKEGYTFAGWDKAIPATMPAISGGVMTVKASWTINSYTICFLNWDNSVIKEVCAKYGERIEAPTPVKKGYTFSAWDKEVPTSMPALDDIMVIKATRWQNNSYKIVFDSNVPTHGTAPTQTMAEFSCVYDTAKSLPTNKFKINGWIFRGWATTPNGAVAYADNATVKNLTATANGTYTLYAVWEVDPLTVSKYVKNPINSSYDGKKYQHYVVSNSDGTNKYTVYLGIDNTPWAPATGKVIIDWSNETELDLMKHTDRNVYGTERYNNVDIRRGTSDVIFIGSPSKTFQNFCMHICGFESKETLNICFVNFKFVTNVVGAINLYEDSGSILTIEIMGDCSIGSSYSGGHIINTPINQLNIVGTGTITIAAGKGADGSSYGAAGAAGGTGIVAKVLNVNISGKMYIYGGNGGNGHSNKNDGSQSNSLRYGGRGGNGGDAIICGSCDLSGNIVLTGGSGGNGGYGHKTKNNAGVGGNGGNGGNGIAYTGSCNKTAAVKTSGGAGGTGGGAQNWNWWGGDEVPGSTGKDGSGTLMQ